MSRPLRLVVLGDSFAFTDDAGPQLPEHPTLYPNVLADRLRDALGRPVDLQVVARAGWTSDQVWRTLAKDRHVQFEVLRGADATVVAIGSFDHVPVGLPRVVGALVPYVRPAAVRRPLRRSLHRAHPRLVRLTSGRLARTPEDEFRRSFDRILNHVRGLTAGAPAVVLGPVGHDAHHYDRRNPHLAVREAIQLELAERHGIPAVAAWGLVRPHIARLNVDGIHWPPDVHATIADALAEPLVAQVRGSLPRPGVPGVA